MKRLLVATMLAVMTLPAIAADVGVSISIGQPGFYGRIDLGDFPPPRVIYRQPVIVERITVERPPIYLRVPPGHAKKWGKHCRKYDACGERVYFVRDDWYNREYVPRYREHHEYRDDRRDGRSEERREERGDHDRRDHGEGRGQGKGR